MPFMDRDSFIRLLEKLGDPDDAATLAAAREIDQRMAEAGITWDMLLVAPPGTEPEAEPEEVFDDAGEEGDGDRDEDGDEDEAAPGDDDAPAPGGPARNSAQLAQDQADLALIEKVLTECEISEETRIDLLDFKQDIADGEFTAMDRKYVQALHARLSGKARR